MTIRCGELSHMSRQRLSSLLLPEYSPCHLKLGLLKLGLFLYSQKKTPDASLDQEVKFLDSSKGRRNLGRPHHFTVPGNQEERRKVQRPREKRWARAGGGGGAEREGRQLSFRLQTPPKLSVVIGYNHFLLLRSLSPPTCARPFSLEEDLINTPSPGSSGRRRKGSEEARKAQNGQSTE